MEINIDHHQIPKPDLDNLCRSIINAATRFFESPENQARFEAWRKTHVAEK